MRDTTRPVSDMSRTPHRRNALHQRERQHASVRLTARLAAAVHEAIAGSICAFSRMDVVLLSHIASIETAENASPEVEHEIHSAAVDATGAAALNLSKHTARRKHPPRPTNTLHSRELQLLSASCADRVLSHDGFRRLAISRVRESYIILAKLNTGTD